MSYKAYFAVGLIGGSTGFLDKIDGDVLNDLDVAFVVTGSTWYVYTLDADSGLAESSPNVISPDDNAGNKRWIYLTSSSDHGGLSGLTDDDHSQYALADKTRPATWVEASDLSGRSISDLGTKDHDLLDGLTDDDHTQYHTNARGDARYLYRENTDAFTPDGDYEPATKKYVDDNAAAEWDGDIADINLDGGVDVGEALEDGDLILIDNGANGTNRKCELSRLKTFFLANYEDLSSYTILDPYSVYTIINLQKLYCNRMQTLGADTYCYKDFGANYFDGDFCHYLTIHSCQYLSGVNPNFWILANVIDDENGMRIAEEDHLNINFYNNLIIMNEWVGSSYWSIGYHNNSPFVLYLTIVRDESVGTYGTLYCYIYSDQDRTNLLQTMTLTLHKKTDFRYLYVSNVFNAGAQGYWTGYVERLNLSGTPP